MIKVLHGLPPSLLKARHLTSISLDMSFSKTWFQLESMQSKLLHGLGVATPFGLVCLVSVLMRAGVIVRSWSRLSDWFCPCWSGGFVLSWFGRVGITGQA